LATIVLMRNFKVKTFDPYKFLQSIWIWCKYCDEQLKNNSNHKCYTLIYYSNSIITL